MRRQAANAHLSARAAANIIIVWYMEHRVVAAAGTSAVTRCRQQCACVYVCDRPQYNNGAAMPSAATITAAIYRSTLSATQSVASTIKSFHLECEDV